MTSAIVLIILIALYTSSFFFMSKQVEKLVDRIDSLERVVYDNRDAIDHPEKDKDKGKFWKGKK